MTSDTSLHRHVTPRIPAAAVFVVATLVLFPLAVRAPIPMTSLGLASLGILHVVLELRYVIGRFARLVHPMLGWIFAFALTILALARAMTMLFPTIGRAAEIVLGFSILGIGCWVALTKWRTPALVVVGMLLAVSLVQPAWYYHVLTHLHNLVPVVFLWDWARRYLGEPARQTFYWVTALWAFIIPIAVSAGLFDSLISTGPGVATVFVGDGSGVIAASAPPGASEIVGARSLAIFAFLQSMHYVVWIGFFPFAGRQESRQFDAALPALRGSRIVIGAAVANLLVLATFLADWTAGRIIYGVIAGYHVYIEFPLLIMLFVGLAHERGAASSRPSPQPVA